MSLAQPQERVNGVLGPGDRIVFLNGHFVEERDAMLSVFDRGFLYGDAVFETAFAWNGAIFKLDCHLERMMRSLRAVCIDLPMTLDALKEAIVETVRRNRLREAYVKWIVTRGMGPGVLLDPTGCVSSVFVFAREYLSLADPAKAAAGISVMISGVKRTPHECLDPRIKNTNYLNLILARIEAIKGGYDDALMLDMQGRLTEAPGYNVFIVKDGTVRTPAEEVLEGVTRETTLELCAVLRIPSETRALHAYDAYTADEVFLTSTAGGFVPIRAVDGRPVGDGRPGPTFRRLREAYQALIESGAHGTPVYPKMPVGHDSIEHKPGMDGRGERGGKAK